MLLLVSFNFMQKYDIRSAEKSRCVCVSWRINIAFDLVSESCRFYAMSIFDINKFCCTY